MGLPDVVGVYIGMMFADVVTDCEYAVRMWVWIEIWKLDHLFKVWQILSVANLLDGKSK